MMRKVLLVGSGLIVLAGVMGIALYQPLIRPWHARWGASDAEVALALAGDELVAGQVFQTTRAIDVHAPAAAVWPWLVQMGQGRGGLYSYDGLENLAGCDIHTLNSIVPELQNLKVGDEIKIGPQQGLPHYQVVLLDPQKALVIRAVNASTGELGGTWGFYLLEKSPALTRLLIRHRDAPSLDATENTVNAIFEPISFVMEQRMLIGLRDHAEKLTLVTGQ